MVSGAEQSSPGCVPEDEGKIAQQVLDTRITPGVIGMQEQLSVTGGVQAAAAAGLKLFDQLRASVQTRIGGFPHPALEAPPQPPPLRPPPRAPHPLAQGPPPASPDLPPLRPPDRPRHSPTPG